MCFMVQKVLLKDQVPASAGPQQLTVCSALCKCQVMLAQTAGKDTEAKFHILQELNANVGYHSPTVSHSLLCGHSAVCLNLLMSSLQPMWKDAQQTLQIVLPNCYKFLQLRCFWGTDPAPVCVGSGIFRLFLPAQCIYAKCELMMKGIVWKSSL